MLKVLSHPLISHKLTNIRKKTTNTKEFAENLDEIAGLMVYDITRDLPLRDIEIETPVTFCTKKEIAKDIVLVPILRAGLGMVQGVRNLIPTAKVAHIGLYRDEETLQPHIYFAKYPKDISESICLVVDPMLATGGSANEAINLLKKQGVKDIKLVCLVGAPEGVKMIEKNHPDVDIYLAELDSHLNEYGYIVPGLGDAGDRIFGTK